MDKTATKHNIQSSENRTCRTCTETKSVDLYYKTGNYYNLDCKECAKAKQRERTKNKTKEQKELENERNRVKYHKTSEIVNEKKREKYAENRESITEYNKAYYHAHKAEMREYKKTYETSDWEQAKRKYQILIRKALKFITNPHDIIPCSNCSVNFLILWFDTQFTPEMNHDNYGIVWTIDHVKPCAQYDLLDPDQVSQCFYWANLRPLLKLENNKKNSCYSHDLLMNQYKMAVEFQKNFSKISNPKEPGLQPIPAHFLLQGPRVVERKTTSTALHKPKRPFRPKKPVEVEKKPVDANNIEVEEDVDEEVEDVKSLNL